jgi:hypothetical protein
MKKGKPCRSQPKPDLINAGGIYEWPDKFLYSDHYHCKECGKTLKCLTRVNWTVSTGVRAIGVCDACAIILIECEDGKKLRWLKLGHGVRGFGL